jgi:ProP effector
MTRWPRSFPSYPDPVRPLVVGVVQVVAAHFPQVSKTLVRHAIALWKQQRMTPYSQALIAGGPRYDLDGNPQGEVSPEHQQRAREELAAWRARRQQKKPQAISQPDQPATASDEGAQVDSQDPTATSES